MQTLVQLIGLSRYFQEGRYRRSVLDDLTGEIRQGECVALLGRSGSGKSTLLNLVAGIDRPDSGDVVIAGTSIGRLSERERTLFRRRHIGFVYQFFNLIPTLTVEENVRLPVELKGNAEGLQRVDGLLESVGLADRRDTYPDRLSGGEQQRVAIARALAHDPVLILADEPTGNLDAETGQMVIALLRDLVRNDGKSLLVATHSAEITGVADRVLVLEAGRLFERRPG